MIQDFERSIKIDNIPIIPNQIIEGIENKKLVLFIGAGVSRLVGCAGWDELARNLINRCFNIKDSKGVRLINFKTKEALRQITDHRKIISICYTLLKTEDKIEEFYGLFEAALKGSGKLKNNIYSELAKIDAHFITTNADEEFYFNFNPGNVKSEPWDFDPNVIDKNILYQIHGTVKKKNTLVFRLTEYFERYESKSKYRSFLDKVFSPEYTILFLGYGINEFEILEFLIQKESHTNQALNKFILQGYYSGEEDLLKLDQYYYNEMKIKVIPYLKDVNGYDQLYEVIKEWTQTIITKTRQLSNRIEEIDNAIE